MFTRKKRNSLKASFERFLKDYHCEYTIDQDEDNGTTYFNFEFQAGHFVASVRRQDDCIDVTYPTMYTAPISQLPLVRSKCNDRNLSNILFKFSYSLNEKSNDVDVHLSFFNNMFDAEIMVHQLKAAFHFQREWTRDFEEAASNIKDYDSSDLESEIYKHQHEMFLLRSLELSHQFDASVRAIATGTQPLTLWQLFETIAPLPDSKLLFMTVNTVSGQQRLEDEEAIRNFDLRGALVEGQGKEARLTRDYALIDLHYKQGRDEQPKLASISITAEGEDDHSIYSRVTLTMPPRNASRITSMSNERRCPFCISILIALDRNDDDQRQKEFEYMWTDALLMLNQGKAESLTEDQQMLGQVSISDIAYNLYWGQQLYNSGRFYEAILHFENVFYCYRKDFFELKSEQKRTFLEVAYKLGFCYNELGLYKQAFYYLDLIANDGNIRHTMELVNAMANGKDMRVFSYTEGVMEEVKRNFNQEEELPENIRQFINFLRRRRGYAYIDFNQLDQAEKIFTRMLDEEENADYAIQELAYIKKLRQQRGEDTTEEASTQANPKDTFGPEDDQAPF